MSATPENAQDDFQPFTKAERITQLNDIDKVLTPGFSYIYTLIFQLLVKLLKSAGQALKMSTSSAALPVQTRIQAFEASTNVYLSTLHTVDVNMQRHIKGLEESKIITVGEKDGLKTTHDPTNAPVGAKLDDKAKPRGSDLDESWLNSRSTKVARDNEAETWKRSRELVEELEQGMYKGLPVKDEAVDVNTTGLRAMSIDANVAES